MSNHCSKSAYALCAIPEGQIVRFDVEVALLAISLPFGKGALGACLPSFSCSFHTNFVAHLQNRTPWGAGESERVQHLCEFDDDLAENAALQDRPLIKMCSVCPNFYLQNKPRAPTLVLVDLQGILGPATPAASNKHHQIFIYRSKSFVEDVKVKMFLNWRSNKISSQAPPRKQYTVMYSTGIVQEQKTVNHWKKIGRRRKIL